MARTEPQQPTRMGWMVTVLTSLGITVGLALASTLGACNKLWEIDRLLYGDGGTDGHGATTAAGGAGAGGGGGGGASSQEDCTNGIDDDGDSLSDCEDSDCAPSAPAGWQLGWTAPDQSVPCPAGAPVELYSESDLQPEPLDCQCECTGSTNCQVYVSCWPNTGASCSGPPSFSWGVGPSCPQATNPDTANGPLCLAHDPGPASQDCGEGNAIFDLDYTWEPARWACLTDVGGSCPSSADRCVPRPPSGAAGPCIMRDGEWPCDSSDYTERTIYFITSATSDSRDCQCPCEPVESGCECQHPACGLRVYFGGSCSGSNANLTVGAGCTAVPTDASQLSFAHNDVPSSAECEATPIVDGGIVPDDAPDNQLTVCCLP